MTKPKVTIYSDGGTEPNPGIGGWAAILIYGKYEKKISGGQPNTTNNQMELVATIKALESLKESFEVEFYTDSEYVKKGITEWLPIWAQNGWQKANKQPVLNLDLWKQLQRLANQHTIDWRWVKGHVGNTYNERVDILVTHEITKLTGEYQQKAQDDLPPSKNPVIALIYGVAETIQGDGGWAAIVIENNQTREFSDNQPKTTTDYMELEAATAVLAKLSPDSQVIIRTSNEYLFKGSTEWLSKWMKNGWQTSKGTPVRHQRLWQKLHDFSQKHNVTWELLTWDNTSKLHNRVKQLAQTQIERIPRSWD